MEGTIFWVLEVEIKEGELDNFRKVMGEMVAATRANEPETMNYEWFISEENRKCHIYERYADSEAVMKHLAAFGEKFADRFLTTLDVKRIVVYGNPDSNVRSALADFGAVFMSPMDGFVR